MKKSVFFVVGPTASGKTDVSIALAGKIKSEIISADSRQIYKNITIASAVPTLEETQGIKHHFLEMLELSQDYSAGMFGNDARALITKLLIEKLHPIVAGGSGLYIKSLIDGFFDLKIDTTEIRIELNEKLEKYGKEFLYNELIKVDPESAGRMSPEFSRRVIRALEVFYSTGEKLSDLHKKKIQIDFSPIQFGLLLERKYLYERINSRVELMVKKGLLDEVKSLMENGYHYSTHNSLNTVGIKEVMMYYENKFSYDEMLKMIKQNTRNYAKRQMTWFNKDKRITWIDASSKSNEQIAEEIFTKIKRTLTTII